MTEVKSLLDAPSVIQQANSHGWHSGFFDFGKALVKNVDYFNCSIIQRGGERLLIVRRAEWDERDAFGYNSIMAFSMQGTKPCMGFKIQMGIQFPQEHFEDPRAITHNGRTFVSACNFVRSKRGMTFPHQVISEVAHDWQLVRRYDPVYGKNGRDAGGNTGHEKNWTWFFHDGQPHMVYMASPHEVVRFNLDFRFVEVYKSEWSSAIWEYGQIRGGTPPVLVDGLYYTFFHSSTPYNVKQRQYHTGCLAFEAKPPFAVKRITLEPLLTGSRFDGGLPAKPPCIFSGGALHDNGTWLIVSGVNDIRCCYTYIPHADLLDRMVEID